MIDEAKQDLLVQYLLGELDPATADKVRAELARDVELREFAAAISRKRLHRWPT